MTDRSVTEQMAEWVATVPVPGGHTAFESTELAGMAQAAGLDAVAADDVPQALRLSRQRASGPARILICGSLYLAGHVLALQGVTVR